MPFITEELWHLIAERKASADLIVSPWPVAEKVQPEIMQAFPIAAEIISEIRNFRQTKGVSPKESIVLNIRGKAETPALKLFDTAIAKLGNLSAIEFVSEKPSGTFPFIVRELECFIPMNDLVDQEEEKKRLNEELTYMQGFLKSVMAKLSNERFVNNAKPDVVAAEQKKKADAEARIHAITEALKSL
jgi:valyl-tRNA synthetase